jgi:uncharacterized Zn finger protein (UPF0148 family)
MNRSLRCQNCGAALHVSQQKSGLIRCDYCETDTVVEVRANPVQAEYSRQFTSRLRKLIDEYFTEDEMRDLVAQLDAVLTAPYRIQYDDLPGRSQSSKALELVKWCERRQLLQALVDVVHAMRPSIEL